MAARCSYYSGQVHWYSYYDGQVQLLWRPGTLVQLLCQQIGTYSYNRYIYFGGQVQLLLGGQVQLLFGGHLLWRPGTAAMAARYSHYVGQVELLRRPGTAMYSYTV